MKAYNSRPATANSKMVVSNLSYQNNDTLFLDQIEAMDSKTHLKDSLLCKKSLRNKLMTNQIQKQVPQ